MPTPIFTSLPMVAQEIQLRMRQQGKPYLARAAVMEYCEQYSPKDAQRLLGIMFAGCLTSQPQQLKTKAARQQMLEFYEFTALVLEVVVVWNGGGVGG
jgi:hypothetical protein